MMMRWMKLAMPAVFLLVAPVASAATYKWVDDKGIVHYGDRAPTPSETTRDVRIVGNSGVLYARPKQAAVVEEDSEAHKAEAKRRLAQERQDNALLATYANEQEIEFARERELKRQQGRMAAASKGLAQSDNPNDKRKLEALLAQGRKDGDAINAKFDAYKVRLRELKNPPKVAQAIEMQRHTSDHQSR